MDKAKVTVKLVVQHSKFPFPSKTLYTVLWRLLGETNLISYRYYYDLIIKINIQSMQCIFLNQILIDNVEHYFIKTSSVVRV